MDIKGTKIGVVGDLHMGCHNGDSGEKWLTEYERLLEWIVESFYGKVETLFFLGDIFDGKQSKTSEKGMSFRTMHFADTFFKKLSDKFEIVMYAGNHDVYYKNKCEVSALSMFKNKPNITVIEDITDFEVGDKQYRIVPWACDPFEDEVEIDAIFAHIDIQSFKLNDYKVSDFGYTPKELFEYCDIVYTGHYHERQIRDYQKGKKQVCYVGTPLQLGKNESGKESFIHILDLEKNKIIEEIKNTFSPKFVTLRASAMLKDPSPAVGNIVEVLWDIPTEENLDKFETLLSETKTFEHKFSFSKEKKDVDMSEMSDISDSISDEKLLEELIDKQESWNHKEKILEKCLELLNITTV